MSDLELLPTGWVLGTIEDSGEYINGFAFKPEHRSETGFPIIRIQNLTDENKPIHLTDIEVDDVYKVTDGDILVSWSATLDAFIWRRGAALVNQHIFKVVPETRLIEKKLLFYWLKIAIEDLQKTEHLHGSTMKHINRGPFMAHKLPFPPKPEQSKILEKLEELLSDLDNGIAELKAAQTKLTQYRQSLLKSAVEGTLTQEWREANTHNITETGEQLLARILKERRARWEQQKLEEFSSKNQTPPKDWQKKYPEPVKPDTSDLPELPDGWSWASVAQLCEIQGGIQKQPKRAPKENKYPFLRVANVYRNELRLDEIHEIELFNNELERLKLELGDILIVEGNGSKSEIGRCALWDCSIDNAVHQNHLIRARPCGMVNAYLLHWLNSPSGMEIMSKLAATTSGLYTLSVSKISKIPVPVCSNVEQEFITQCIDSGINDFNQQLSVVEVSLQQSDAQRNNILKDAFSGKLVPQDPSDEPASVLLEKIKAERLVQAKQPKQTKKKEPSMNKLDAIAIKKWVSQQAEAFTFEQLQSAFKGDYEALKETVFEILQEEPAVIKQVFNEQRQYMMFEKATK